MSGARCCGWRVWVQLRGLGREGERREKREERIEKGREEGKKRREKKKREESGSHGTI